MEITLRIPIEQYSFMEYKFIGTPDEALHEYRRIVALSKAPVTPENGLNSGLKPLELLRLLYKPLCNQGLQFEEIESLGTEKIYSQKDVLKIVQSLINKSKREN